MDFALSEEETMIFDMAYDFGQASIAPFAGKWEHDGTIPKAVLREGATLGLAAIYVPEEQGGSGLNRVASVLIHEALAMSCPSIAAFNSIHNMATSMIAKHGSDEFKDKWLQRLIQMEAIASYCLTEPSTGSDASALRTRAVRDGDQYALSGAKSFISGGGYSDLYIVMSRTGEEGPKGISAICVPDGTEGLRFGAPERKMGWKAQPTAEVIMENCSVPASHRLGEEGQGFRFAMEGLDGGRLNIAACSLGGAQVALDKVVQYMNERHAFGRKLLDFQALQFRLAEMQTKLQVARVFLRQAAWKLDQQEADATQHCAMAKLFVTDTAFEVANDALQLFGGYGYLEDFGIEKIVRDLRVHQILEGTNEIMRLIIARNMIAKV